jgi:anhydro-N-acetylmuramic acid kinase
MPINLDYDDKGALAKQEPAITPAKWIKQKFYHRKHPKSLGFEFVKETILPIMNSYSLPIVDF